MKDRFAQYDGSWLQDLDLEKRLRDAAFVAVGLGVMAYTLSAPYRQKAREAVEQLLDDACGPQSDRSRQ